MPARHIIEGDRIMSVSDAHLRRALLGIALALAAAQPVWASPPECTCRNLESLQQDYQNAVYLAGFFADLSAHMKAFEDNLLEAKKDPNNIDYTTDFWLTTGAEKNRYIAQNVRLPFKLEGYEGPPDVAMIHGTCRQHDKELAEMEDKSPCKGIADAALNHEARHREICLGMGKDAYWDRRQSEYTAEEAAAYEQQAVDLKDELRRVLDAATITYDADWTFDLSVGGMAQYVYAYSGESEDIGGATAGDTWTMTGKGTSKITWVKAMIAGMQCTPSGAVNSTYDLKMTTDGLTFGLELTGLSATGGLSIKCPGPGGGGGPVGDAGGEGVLAKDLPLKQGLNSLPGDMGEVVRAMMAGLGTVGGGGTRTLSITCGAP
jgi:hypothetical protein